MQSGKSPSIAIVVTTIFEPNFLDGYVANLRRFGRENVEIIDGRTPASLAERVWDDGGREFLVDTASNMRAWLDAVRTIG
jgi:hypothetical protein